MPVSIALYPALTVESGLTLSYRESSQRLRFALTYFPEVAIVPFGPSGWLTNFMSRDEFSAVISGLATTLPDRPVSVSNVRVGMFDADIDMVFNALNDQQPGQWAISTPPCTFWNGGNFGYPHLLSVFERILPVPSFNVPLSEISDFRKLHEKELVRFLDQLDEIVDCAAAGEQRGAERKLRTLLDEVSFIEHSMKSEGWSPLKVDISFKRIASAGLMGAASSLIAVLAGLNPILAAFLGGAAGAISIEDNTSASKKLSNQIPRSYEYIVGAFYEYGNSSPFLDVVHFDKDVEQLVFADNRYVARFPGSEPSESKISNSMVVGNQFG